MPPIHLTPATSELSVAADWFRRFEGAGLDGVIAKPISGTYEPNKRVMLKVKHERDCDCVVAGFRWHKKGQGTAVGSLLLGLFDESGALQHVGVCASFTERSGVSSSNSCALSQGRARRSSLETLGRAWTRDGEAGHRMPGGQSRWSQGKDLSWEPLRPELVVEVAYDHMQGSRFRHMAQFRRWRTDKKPSDCTYDQLEVVPPQELAEIFAERPLNLLLTLLRSTPVSPFTSWIVIRFRSFLRRAHASGTFRRFTRIRVQVDDRPRMESISTHLRREAWLLRDVCSSTFLDPQGRLPYSESSRSL